MRAADFIVQNLKAHGITRVYCVPGESYLALLDAFYESGIEVIICRHEGGAGFMAVAEAKLTNKPAVVLASRGPGATNVSIAIHTAEQDAVPLIVMLGQVSREERLRGTFQEMDYTHVFGTVAKAVYEVASPEKLPELLPRGLNIAQKGVPGPVVFSYPEDILYDEISGNADLVFPLPVASHAPSLLPQIQRMIDASERPLIMAGARLRTTEGKVALKRFAEAQRIPVAVTWKNQDIFDNSSPLYAGHSGNGNPETHRKLLREADLIIAVGTRLGDFGTFNYTLPSLPEPKQSLIHVYPDASALGRVYASDIVVLAEPAPLLNDLSQTARVGSSARESWISRLSTYMIEFTAFKPRNPTDGVDFGEVVMALAAHAPKNCVVTTDAGNMSTWVHRHWKMTPDNMLIGGISGAMGIGVPAAIAASINQPERMAICIVGDGGVLMTGNELATAKAFGATPKIVISNNNIYGTIRTHQEREFPGRVSGTKLVNPDFAVWAKSFGADVFELTLGDDVETTVKQFLTSPNAAVLHVKSSATSLSAFGVMKSAS
jgi:acetolactate synthase I/II/III large subunit